MTDKKTEKSYIDKNGNALELDEDWFKTASRGRPAMTEAEYKPRPKEKPN